MCVFFCVRDCVSGMEFTEGSELLCVCVYILPGALMYRDIYFLI